MTLANRKCCLLFRGKNLKPPSARLKSFLNWQPEMCISHGNLGNFCSQDSKFIGGPRGVCLIDFSFLVVDLPLCVAWPERSRLECWVVAPPPSQQTATTKKGKGYFVIVDGPNKASIQTGPQRRLESLSVVVATGFKLNNLAADIKTGESTSGNV